MGVVVLRVAGTRCGIVLLQAPLLKRRRWPELGLQRAVFVYANSFLRSYAVDLEPKLVLVNIETKMVFNASCLNVFLETPNR